jgi:hypothetical protein
MRTIIRRWIDRLPGKTSDQRRATSPVKRIERQRSTVRHPPSIASYWQLLSSHFPVLVDFLRKKSATVWLDARLRQFHLPSTSCTKRMNLFVNSVRVRFDSTYNNESAVRRDTSNTSVNVCTHATALFSYDRRRRRRRQTDKNERQVTSEKVLFRSFINERITRRRKRNE